MNFALSEVSEAVEALLEDDIMMKKSKDSKDAIVSRLNVTY
jgi:hypothetical protein